jgi:hypothetical protein
MRKVIKDVYIAETMLGKGGRDKMTFADWGRIGNMVRRQYSFLARFAQDIKDGKLSPKQIAARARLYIRPALATLERGQLSAHGISSSLLQLPVMVRRSAAPTAAAISPSPRTNTPGM